MTAEESGDHEWRVISRGNGDKSSFGRFYRPPGRIIRRQELLPAGNCVIDIRLRPGYPDFAREGVDSESEGRGFRTARKRRLLCQSFWISKSLVGRLFIHESVTHKIKPANGSFCDFEAVSSISRLFSRAHPLFKCPDAF
jgi:hypothetical protein